MCSCWKGRKMKEANGVSRRPDRRGRPSVTPTCLTVVAEEALWTHAQVGPTTVLTPASVLAGAGGTGIHLWRTPKGLARAAGRDSGGGRRGQREDGIGGGKEQWPGEGNGAPVGRRGSQGPPAQFPSSLQVTTALGVSLSGWLVQQEMAPGFPSDLPAALVLWDPPERTLPVSQWVPTKPSGHWQMKALGRSLQEPPFLQGCAWHSSVSAQTGDGTDSHWNYLHGPQDSFYLLPKDQQGPEALVPGCSTLNHSLSPVTSTCSSLVGSLPISST